MMYSESDCGLFVVTIRTFGGGTEEN